MRIIEGKDYHHDKFLLWLNKKWSDFPNQSTYKNHESRWQWPALPGPIWQGELREGCACSLGRSLGQSIILLISNINVTIFIVIIIHQNHHLGRGLIDVMVHSCANLARQRRGRCQGRLTATAPWTQSRGSCCWRVSAARNVHNRCLKLWKEMFTALRRRARWQLGQKIH